MGQEQERMASSAHSVMNRPSEDPLLNETLARRQPGLLALLPHLADGTISDPQRESIQMTLNDEFLKSGLGADDEPNERGLKLERLIDEVSPYAEQKREQQHRGRRGAP